MATTFSVSPVDIETKRLPTRSPQKLLELRGVRGIEAVSTLPSDFVECEPYNGFLMAIHTAYAKHYPLVLSPDDVWLTIAQGLARHINEHAEQLRSRLVRHEGQLELKVQRDEFIPGSQENDWQGVFAEFSVQLKEHLGGRRDLFLCNFSTTDFLSKAASEVVLMGAVKQFFSFTVMSMCGIPSITLLGTPQDWKNISQRVEALGEFDLGWWVEALRPVVAQFEAASRGEVDEDFWQEMYKLHAASGGDQISGWVNALFPYLNDSGDKKNPHINSWKPKGFFSRLFSKDENSMNKGPKISDYPSGMTQAPFTWKFLGGSRSMSFSAGFFGVLQTEEGAIKPQLGWAVTESLGSGKFNVMITNGPRGEVFKVSPTGKVTNLEGLRGDTKTFASFELSLWFSEALVSLKGIEEAQNIYELGVLGANKLTDLSALEGVPGLKVLRIQQCEGVDDISVLRSLPLLEEFGLSHCPNVKDLTPIATLTHLRLLDLFEKSMPKEISGRHNTPEAISRVQKWIRNNG